MQHLFKNILATEGVKGALLLSTGGDILFERFTSPLPPEPANVDWIPFIGVFADINEADVIFDKFRLYVRKTDSGYLIIFIDLFTSMAMVRLHTDLLLPALRKEAAPKGLKRFFKSKK